ncbi:MAG: capsule assembly Wzi family protein [Enterobacterales bacterium]|nr:capsule assembly Wzi family protein [Enterobacterales bacterium]
MNNLWNWLIEKFFGELKKAARNALGKSASKQLRFSLSNAEPVFRSFGDFESGKGQLTALSSGVNKDFAWRVQANRRYHPLDGQTINYDGSYISAIWGNWATTLGSVEQWWGPSWDAANLLSNNARPTVALRLQRNYSDASELPILNWIGRWNFSGFIGALSDQRMTDHPYLAGAHFSAKPLDSVETSLAMTSLMGGAQKLGERRLDINYQDQKRQVAFDISWQINQDLKFIPIATKIYASLMDDNSGADYSSVLFGFSSQLPWLGGWRIFLEHSETLAAPSRYNLTYEDQIYQTGYRFYQRSIGSSYDADSKVTSLGLMSQISYFQWLSIKLQNIHINQAGNNSPIDLRHSINPKAVNAKRLLVKWRYRLNKEQQLNLEFDYSDKLISANIRENERVRLMIGWVLQF